MPELAKFEIVFPYQFTWFCILAVSASYFLVIIVLKYLAVLPSSSFSHQLLYIYLLAFDDLTNNLNTLDINIKTKM